MMEQHVVDFCRFAEFGGMLGFRLTGQIEMCNGRRGSDNNL